MPLNPVRGLDWCATLDSCEPGAPDGDAHSDQEGYPARDRARLVHRHRWLLRKLSINEQRAAIDELTRIVRAWEQFQKAEAADRLIKLPTGDGMALSSLHEPGSAAQCAIEINRALKEHPRLQLRMGIHSGPVSGVIDVNGRADMAGAGLNIAQRIMDCGDGGHILLSRHVARDWKNAQLEPALHDLVVRNKTWSARLGCEPV